MRSVSVKSPNCHFWVERAVERFGASKLAPRRSTGKSGRQVELGAGSEAPGWGLGWVVVWAGVEIMAGKGSMVSVIGKIRQTTTLTEVKDGGEMGVGRAGV